MLYPIELIKASTYLDRESKSKKAILYSAQMRCLKLYCLQRIDDDQFIPLNRDYKPLGITDRKYVKYEEYPFLFIPKSEINFSALWDNSMALGRAGYYTYSDGSNPIDLESFERYQQIIECTFFLGPESIDKKGFEKFWGYKKRGGYNTEGYELQIKERFDK